MRKNQNGASADAAEERRGPSEIVGYDHRLAVAWHEGVHHPGDRSSRHCSEELDEIEPGSDSSQLGACTAIKPTLDITEKFHR